MKATFFSASAALAAAVLAISSTTASADVQGRPSGLARRHHGKVARAVAEESHMLEKRAFKGKATWYGVHAGDMGACGTHLNADDYFVALNQGQYGNLNQQSSYCGKKITITNGIKTTQATILDACPKGVQCHWGALDMSRSLFSFFNDFGVGVFDITWWISGEGGDNSGSSSSSSSSDNGSSSSSSSNNDNSNDNSNNDASAAEQAAQDKAAKQRAAAKKEAATKKKKAEEKKAKEEAAKKKKEEAAKKKKAAAKKAKAEAAKKAEEKVREAQNQNIAAFGEIMQQLNAMVENAVDNGSSSSADAATTATTSA